MCLIEIAESEERLAAAEKHAETFSALLKTEKQAGEFFV